MIGKEHRKGKLFILTFGTHASSTTTCFLAPSSTEINSANNLWRLWHYGLGHPHSFNLNSLFSFGILPGKLDHKHSINETCEDCALAKSHTLPFNRSLNHATFAFDIIQTDVWGPTRVGSLFGKYYYVLFVDDWSRFSWVYFLRQKSEVM